MAGRAALFEEHAPVINVDGLAWQFQRCLGARHTGESLQERREDLRWAGRHGRTDEGIEYRAGARNAIAAESCRNALGFAQKADGLLLFSGVHEPALGVYSLAILPDRHANDVCDPANRIILRLKSRRAEHEHSQPHGYATEYR
ncbi:MAG: hypothetical protein JJD97_04970 [Gemmatimonadaceae bacterium]|nr:hypothetical protein [Gemmatimonadaceae bacterium]